MSDDSAADSSSLDLKKRARRRLVGAAALALLAVIVLPIVMDSEPKSGGQEIQIRIPGKEGEPLAAATIPVPAVPLPPQRDAEKPDPTVDVLANQSQAPERQEPADAPKAKPEVAVKKPEAAKKTEVARAEAVLEGKDSAQWVVQLGAYQNAANVKQLTSKLKEAGIPSFTEKFDSPQGVRTRVRAGPFPSRDAADKARERIKKFGVDGQVAQK